MGSIQDQTTDAVDLVQWAAQNNLILLLVDDESDSDQFIAMFCAANGAGRLHYESGLDGGSYAVAKGYGSTKDAALRSLAKFASHKELYLIRCGFLGCAKVVREFHAPKLKAPGS